MSACLTALAPLEGASTATVAGTGVRGFSGDGGPANAAQINDPFGVVRGPDGALWFCEYGGQRVRRIAAEGTISTVAGSGTKGYAGDGGPALAAAFNLPHEIRFDRAGNLFIVDMQNHAVRRVDSRTQRISTVAGTGQPGYSGDGGPATAAQLNQPHSIQFDPAGDLYICDIRNNVIRKVAMKTGVIATFAGTGKAGDTPDASPIAGTPLRGPRTLDFDAQGNLWLATREGNQVFKFDLAAGKIHHIAGTGAKGYAGDGGPAKLATLNGPKGLTLDRAGRVYLVDTENQAIRVIDPKTGLITTLAGNGQRADGPDGDPLKCALNRPHGIWVDPDGTVFIGDSENHRVRAVK
jgi:DNA-binding beta-propeller fold protein YncE